MGMMQGKAVGDTFIVVDSFALPVEGTETRVNAAEGAYEYLATYPETAKVQRHSLSSPLDALLWSPALPYVYVRDS